MDAVIVKGNPRYIEGNPAADDFYREIEEFLTELGFDSVSFDEGKPNTVPKIADLWVGHSRGVDRLHYASEDSDYDDTVMVGLGAPGEEEFPIINHPQDSAPETGKPNKFHYVLTDEMKIAILYALIDAGHRLL